MNTTSKPRLYSIYCALIVLGIVIPGLMLLAQRPAISDKPDTPFKLATFETQGKTRVGMALGDHMLDLTGVNAYVEKQASLPAVKLPTEMRELIEQYPAASKRMYQIANYLKDKKVDGQAFAFSLLRSSSNVASRGDVPPGPSPARFRRQTSSRAWPRS